MSYCTNKLSYILFSVAPAVESVPANGQMIVMEGEPATLQCNLIRGSPEPEIKWRRKVCPREYL